MASTDKGAGGGGAGPLILSERDGRCQVITLNRPDKLNAINEQMAVELMAALDAAEADREVLAVVIQGNERLRPGAEVLISP